MVLWQKAVLALAAVLLGSSLAAGAILPVRAAKPRGWTTERYVDALIHSLGSEDSRVRRDAARALGRLGPFAQSALESLTCATGDLDESVRCAAWEALERIKRGSPNRQDQSP